MEHLRQHGYMVHAALHIPEHGFAAAEVEVFDAQLEGFQDPQPPTVLEVADQARNPVQLVQNDVDLLGRQNGGQAFRLARPHHSFDAVQGLFQYLLVKKQQRRQSLVLRGSGDVFLYRKMGQETVDVAFGQVARMGAGVKDSEAANPSVG